MPTRNSSGHSPWRTFRFIRRAEFGVGVLGLVGAGLVVLSFLTISRADHRHLDQIAVLSEVDHQLAEAHLWFEEAIGGDASVDVQRQFFGALESIARISDRLRDGAEPADLAILDAITANVSAWRESAGRRLVDARANQAGSAGDAAFDIIYLKLIDLTAQHRTSTAAAFQRSAEFARFLLFAVVATLFLLTGLSVWFTRLSRIAGSRAAALNAENVIRQTSESVQRESEARVQVALDAADTSMWESNPETGHVVHDRRWSTMLGGPPRPTEMTFQELSEFVPREDRPAVLARMIAVLKGEQDLYTAVHRVQHRDGHWLWVESRGRVIKRNAAGRATRMVGTNTDVTLRRIQQKDREVLAEKLSARSAELAATERLLREMTDGAPAALYQLEWLPRGGLKFNFMSGGVAALTGIQSESACANSANVFNLVVREDRRRLWSLMRQCGEDRRSWQCEFRIRRADGSIMWTRSVANISQDRGRTLWNGYWVDISESRKTQADLESANAAAEAAIHAKRQFLASMSHEIRTPLNGIVANLELLAHTSLTGTQADLLADADMAGKSLKAVIGNVLDFSKIESGHLNLEIGEMSVTSVVREAVGILQSEARRKGFSIIAWLSPDIPKVVSGDSARLRQILLNLLGNSVKYTARGGVFVVVRVVNGVDGTSRLYFAIHDSGRGFEPSEAARLFEPFTRASESCSNEEGTGLGLPICKRLVEALGGELEAIGVPGQGATFRFTLPSVAIGAAPVWPPLDFTGKRVLAVACDASAPNRVVRYFRERRATVEYIATMTEAMHATFAANAAGRPFDFAVIADLVISPSDRKNARILWDARVVPFFYRPDRTVDEWRPRLRDGSSFLVSNDDSPAWLDANITAMVATMRGPGASRSETVELLEDRPDLSSLRVLVLEDRLLNQAAIGRQLAHFGANYAISGDGREGLDALAERAFDLVLADCAMPNMDGFAFARAVRQSEADTGSGRRLPIIALTANAFREDAEKCLAAGMDAVLSKPVSLQDLGATLERWGLNEPAAGGISRRVPIAAEPGGPPIDVAVLEEILGGPDPAVFAQMVQDFAASARVACDEVAISIDRGDPAGIAAAAHGAKGEALTAGARRLGELYARIESKARAGERGAGDVLAEVREELMRVNSFVAEYTRQSP